MKIRYPEDLVKDKYVTYADWRFRPADVEKTMANILASQDITFAKEGDKKYKPWKSNNQIIFSMKLLLNIVVL